MNKITPFSVLLFTVLLVLCGPTNTFLFAQPIFTTPSCVTNFDLTWDSSPSASGEVAWPSAGTTSHTFSNVDNSGINISFAFTGDVATLGDWNNLGGSTTPNLGTNASNGGMETLQYFTDGFNTVGTMTITITFSQPISAIGFDIYHVNGAGPNGDSYTITASTSTGGTIYPTFTSSATPSYTTNTSGFVDSDDNSTSGTNAIVGVNFSDADGINSITLIWDDCTACTQGAVHGSAFSNMSFCPMPIDSDGDGIADAIDIDDDNDGILDEIESCGSMGTATTEAITIEILLDDYASETNWTLKNSMGTTILSGGGYSASDNNTVKTATYADGFGDYVFNITDAASDGICCGYGIGHYEIKVGGSSIIGGSGSGIGNFGASKTENFSAGTGGAFSCVGGDPSDDDDDDGTINYKDADFCTLNANGVCNSLDTDGDGIIDQLDVDSDNDGIPDLIEIRGVDSDADGRADTSTDTDEDGLVDLYDNDDADGPAVAGCTIGVDCDLSSSTSLLMDTDANGSNEEDGDFDGDGQGNWVDLDADGDGILDIIEAGGTDSNGDGVGDSSTDADEDGYFDIYDTDASDGPGGTGSNGTSLMRVFADGGDGDSRPEYTDNGGTGDTDGDDVPDFLDVDADNDGIYDIYEAQATVGYSPPSGSDSDKDGIDNTYDDDDANWGGGGSAGLTPVNTDAAGDDFPDYVDTDSDGDGTTDIQEAWDALDDGDDLPDAVVGSCTTDNDGDGYVDCFDSNDNDKATWTSAVSPPDDDGTAGSTSSSGVDISASNDITDIFPNNGGGNSSTHPDWRDEGISPFPVEWLDFGVRQDGVDASIYWITASESNANFFGIERSLDAQTFRAIGQQEANGTTSEISNYQYTDPDIDRLSSNVIYYRLRQVDMDGSFTFSSIVELTLSEHSADVWLQPYPVPVSDVLTVEYKLLATPAADLEVVSTLGNRMYSKYLTNPSGQIQLSVQKWSPGFYYVNLTSERQKAMYKVLVKH